MKHRLKILTAAIVLFLISGCTSQQPHSQIAATTLPVYEFTSRLCEGTELNVTRLVNESVSCLHDYSLNVDQVRAVESAEVIIINGAGLEEFMEDLLHGKQVIDASSGIEIIECAEEHHHEHDDDDSHGHHHEVDSHIWLSTENAMVMARNICAGLSGQYPHHKARFEANLTALQEDLDALQRYGDSRLTNLTSREIITFHDGFSYLAQAFDLTILEAVEEESGSEASAAELKHLITLTRENDLPAIFTEINGSSSAASVIARETGAAVFALDMAMSGDSWFDAMYHNIDTLKEALE